MPMIHQLSDEDYESLYRECRASKKPHKWKGQVQEVTGQISVIRYDAKQDDLHMMRNNQRELVVSYSTSKEVAKHMLITCPSTRVADLFNQVVEANPTAEQFERRMADLATGNHRSRNRSVQVPSRAREPVRG